VIDLKDYEHVVIWLDYFNKTLTKKMGRKLPKDKCVFDPSLKELIDASIEAGFEPKESDDKVRFPRRAYVRSGYIVLPKVSQKTKILYKISDKLIAKRAKSQR
jgi:signal recognition particle subunit SRP19